MRTYNEIYQSIIDKKNSTAELSGLDSISQTAIWKLLAHLTATAIFIFEGILYSEKSIIETQIERSKYGFIDWYSTEALSFQYGDSLVFDNTTGVYSYNEIDKTKKIIARAAAIENPITAQIGLKVAKDSGGSLIKLTVDELTAFSSYINTIKVAGTNIIIISDDADIISINGTVKFNAQYSESDISTAINAALNEYKLNFNYNGIIRRNDIIEVIRDVEGVVDFIPSVLSVQASGSSSVAIDDEYETYSGYFNYSISKPESNFTYVAI